MVKFVTCLSYFDMWAHIPSHKIVNWIPLLYTFSFFSLSFSSSTSRTQPFLLSFFLLFLLSLHILSPAATSTSPSDNQEDLAAIFMGTLCRPNIGQILDATDYILVKYWVLLDVVAATGHKFRSYESNDGSRIETFTKI